jgi:hypothetical protein
MRLGLGLGVRSGDFVKAGPGQVISIQYAQRVADNGGICEGLPCLIVAIDKLS